MEPGQKLWLHLELPTLTVATPDEATALNGKNKVSSINMYVCNGTFQKINHFQNVKRAAGVHSYYLML